ncbi:MAG: V-type ATPase subunit [Patescibacteria group bacterium]|nr:V-type ATPase subunit [Patescibacteria group bacterium]
MSSRDDYLYASGVVRSLESRSLSYNDIERMVDAPDLASAFKVFHDTDYFDNVQDLKPEQFLLALDEDLKQVFARIREMAPDEEIVKFIFMRNDFRNMKLLYKEALNGKNIDEHLSAMGNEDPAKLKRAIAGEKVSILPYCQRAIDYVRKRVEDESKGATPALLERWFDRKYFKEYSDQAKVLASPFIEDFVRLQLDIANLKTFIRGKLMALSKEYIISEILYNERPDEAGSLSLEFFTSVVNLPLDEALAKIRMYFSVKGQKVLDQYLSDRSLEQLERNLENLELDYLRTAKLIDRGPELILAYYYGKRSNIRNTRLIMTGQANQLPSREVKKLLRELY